MLLVVSQANTLSMNSIVGILIFCLLPPMA